MKLKFLKAFKCVNAIAFDIKEWNISLFWCVSDFSNWCHNDQWNKMFLLLCWNIVHVLFLSNKFTWFDISVQNTFVGHCMCKNNLKYLLTIWIYFNDLLRIQINNLTIMSYVKYYHYKVLPNIILSFWYKTLKCSSCTRYQFVSCCACFKWW